MRVPRFGVCVFLPGVFLHSRVTGACPVTTDLSMRVKTRVPTRATAAVVPRYLVPGIRLFGRKCNDRFFINNDIINEQTVLKITDTTV